MKIKGILREIFNPVTGKTEPSLYPTTREESQREGLSKFYVPGGRCPVHGNSTMYFTISENLVCCATDNAIRAYNEARHNGEPLNPGDAHKRGMTYYWSMMPNSHCGHNGKRTIDGKCYTCVEKPPQVRPRLIARANNEMWYMPLPTDPCKAGHLARRRVNNGSCEQCEIDARALPRVAGPAPSVKAEATDIPLHVSNPDIIISRKDAKALGFTMYRTGKPCSHGHTGFRYTISGNCIPCITGGK